MTTTLTDPIDTVNQSAEHLRSTMAAARVSLKWLGVRKALSADQKARAAASFGAESEFLSAGKKLLDTRHPAYRAVTSVRHRLQSYFHGVSLPYPEPGVRLIRATEIGAVNHHLEVIQGELHEAVNQLDEQLDVLRLAARDRLGQLFNASDYPQTLIGLFDVIWDFPSVEPPQYLQHLSPRLYAEQCARVTARFEEAVRLAEVAFTEELGRLVSHLCERLTGGDDGRPKVFRDSAIARLSDFFERFRTLNIRSSEELDQLVERARSVMSGVQPQQLRDNRSLRQQVGSELAAVQSVLDGLLVDRPRRNILRSSLPTEAP